MKNSYFTGIVLLFTSLTVLACGLMAPPPVPQVTPSTVQSPDQAVEPPTATAEADRPESTAAPTKSPALPTATETSIPTEAPAPLPTEAPLALEVLQTQTWTDNLGNIRTNVLFRNPYDFPVAPTYRAQANLLDEAGAFMRGQKLLFLDGISGGHGFLLPGETIAANACFTCELEPLSAAWGSVEIVSAIEDASTTWDYSTEVEAETGSVTFERDSPIFWVSGTVKNNTDTVLQRISVRIIVYDQEGELVGAAEASAWDVGAGATVSFDGYGIGQPPDGPVRYEVSALGVNY